MARGIPRTADDTAISTWMKSRFAAHPAQKRRKASTPSLSNPCNIITQLFRSNGDRVASLDPVLQTHKSPTGWP